MVAQNHNAQANQRTLEQRRAEHAWNCIESVKNLSVNRNDDKKDVRSLAIGAPAGIQTNGLGQTLAFWKAKGKFEHQTLLAAVSTWLFNQGISSNADLLAWIRDETTSTDKYRRATAEAIAFLIWVKRFAEAELPKE